MNLKCTPKSAKIRPKRHSRLIICLLHCWQWFLNKNESQNDTNIMCKSTFECVWIIFGRYFFTCVFVDPHGSILVSFGRHFEAPGLHSILEPFGTHVAPQRLKFGAMRFLCLLLSFLSVYKIFYTSLRHKRQTLRKTFYQCASQQQLPDHRGRRYCEALYVYLL